MFEIVDITTTNGLQKYTGFFQCKQFWWVQYFARIIRIKFIFFLWKRKQKLVSLCHTIIILGSTSMQRMNVGLPLCYTALEILGNFSCGFKNESEL